MIIMESGIAYKTASLCSIWKRTPKTHCKIQIFAINIKRAADCLILPGCQHPRKLFLVRTGCSTGRSAAAGLLSHLFGVPVNMKCNSGPPVGRIRHQGQRIAVKFQPVKIRRGCNRRCGYRFFQWSALGSDFPF